MGGNSHCFYLIMEKMKVGLQLYSIRDAMNADMEAALKAVKEMGYDCVEIAGGRYGHTGSENKALCEKYGLECVSAHQSPSFYLDNKEDALQYIKELGVEFCVIPMTVGRLETLQEKWDETVSLYREMSEAFRAEGIQLLYHNHDFEMVTLAGESEPLLDKLYREVPMLNPEFDTCWVSYGGYSPADYIRKYASRVDVIHIKDYKLKVMEQKPMWQQIAEKGWEIRPEKRSEAGFAYTPVGTGVEDFDLIIAAAQEAGARYLIVEQDDSKDRDPLEAAAMSRAFLKEKYGI